MPKINEALEEKVLGLVLIGLIIFMISIFFTLRLANTPSLEIIPESDQDNITNNCSFTNNTVQCFLF